MATEGDKLTIKVDPGQFDMLAKASKKAHEAVGFQMKDALKASALMANAAAKAIPFTLTGKYTVDDDGGPLFIPDEASGPAENEWGYDATEEQISLASEIVNFGPPMNIEALELGPDPEAGPFALKPKPVEPLPARASLVEVDNG